MSNQSTRRCPFCKEEIEVYTNFKVLDCKEAECLNCGFHLTAYIDQYDIDDLNDRREEYNDSRELSDGMVGFLPAISQEEYAAHRKVIRELGY